MLKSGFKLQEKRKKMTRKRKLQEKAWQHSTGRIVQENLEPPPHYAPPPWRLFHVYGIWLHTSTFYDWDFLLHLVILAAYCPSCA